MEAAVKKSLYIALFLLLFAVTMRLLPHPANFAPVGAVSLFGAMVLPKRIGWWLPVLAMVISDIFLGFYGSIWFTWLGFFGASMVGLWLKNHQGWWRVPAGVLLGAVSFFIISNFGVWAVGGLYPHTFAGFMQCYAAAIPFFRASLLADAIYSTVLFGAYALAMHQAKFKLVGYLDAEL